MRECPNCKEPCISKIKLAFQYYIPGVVAYCSNCYAMVELEDQDNFISIIVTDWIIAALLLVSIFYFGVLWIGVSVFVLWRLIRLYFKVKGPLINAQ